MSPELADATSDTIGVIVEFLLFGERDASTPRLEPQIVQPPAAPVDVPVPRLNHQLHERIFGGELEKDATNVRRNMDRIEVKMRRKSSTELQEAGKEEEAEEMRKEEGVE